MGIDFSEYDYIEIECPYCGKEFEKPAAGLNDHPEFPCPLCGEVLNVHKTVKALCHDPDKLIAQYRRFMTPSNN